MSGLPKIVLAIIDAIGFVEKGDVTYRPVIPAPITMSHNGRQKFCPLPERVTFSTLRNTVIALSDRETPGCIIANDLLANPDEIMPEQYGTDELLSDIRSVGALTPVMQKIAPKYAVGMRWAIEVCWFHLAWRP